MRQERSRIRRPEVRLVFQKVQLASQVRPIKKLLSKTIMKKLLPVLFCCIVCFVPAQAKNEIDVLLKDLDKTIAERPLYVEKRESEILQFKQELAHVVSLEEQYRIIGNIINGYLSFIYDSAEVYIQKRLDIAQKLNLEYYIQESKLQLSFLYSRSGLFTQANELLNTIPYEDLANPNLRPRYCWYYIRYYENLIKYTDNSKFSVEYIAKIIAYREMLIDILPENGDLRRKEIAFQLQENGEYTEAYRILNEIYAKQNSSTNSYVTGAMGMAKLYHLMDSSYQEKKYLILAAIADIKMSVKENEALLTLAMILFREGDINRAYNYVKVALEDANFYNSRFRNTVIARMQPVIENTYLFKIQQQKDNLRLFATLLAFFVIALAVTIFLIFRQNRIVSKARENLKTVNDQLIGLNRKLDEANLVKEEYIGYFMNQCSLYIDKMDSYRKFINRKVKARQIDELYSLTSSTLAVDEAVNELFNTFDEVFLKLYPDFVEKVNFLLKEDEEYRVKKGLNTELRILALIRLGIIDTNQIAVFLRFSVQTIYNYRSRIRKKAKKDQNTFEEKIKKIGSFSLQ